MAEVDVEQPLQQFKDLLGTATSMEELQYLCEYVFKTTKKDIPQVRRHAQDIKAAWENESGIEQFIEFIVQLNKICSGIFVVLSWVREPSWRN